MAINNTGSRRLIVTLTALFAALCGLYLLIGGGWLVAIGGSWYYPIAGLVMLGVAWMLWRSKRAALWLYAALLLGTMIWGVWEVGFDLSVLLGFFSRICTGCIYKCNDRAIEFFCLLHQTDCLTVSFR